VISNGDQTPDVSARLPSALEPPFELVRPDPVLRRLVSSVSQHASLTAEQDTPGYIGVRPAVQGAIAGYVNKTFIDLRLAPERAKQLALATGWRLYGSNSYTGTLRVTAQVLRAPDVMARVVDLFHEALEKSESGPPFEGGAQAAKNYSVQRELCPQHYTEKLGGFCDKCE
jgi:hypothetical protein